MDQSRENIIEDSQDEIDIGELLRYLKTKWIVIVAVFLIGVIGAGVGTKCLITPKYTAVSKLYVVSASGKNIVNQKKIRHLNLNRIWSLPDCHLNRKLPERFYLRNLHRCVFLSQTVSVLKYLIPADRN